MKRRLLSCCLLSAGGGLVFCLLAAPPLPALPEPTLEELKANRDSLEQWRKHPDQLTRLRRDARAFAALTDERREQILKLDQDLREEVFSTQTRLMNVMERYAKWRERRSDEDRRAIDSAADKTARLAVIRELRDREWMQTQPLAVLEEWAELKGTERAERVRELRQEDRKRRHEWMIATRFWKELEGKQFLPARAADLDTRDRAGVELLTLFLSDEEKFQLAKAEGNWPAYPLTLVTLADRHPLALRGPNGPKRFMDLPKSVQAVVGRALFKSPKKKMLDGEWPALAQNVVDVMHNAKIKQTLPDELWAYSYECLAPSMKEYVDKTLRNALTDNEKERLAYASGKWPLYPETIADLAEKHQLAAPPWQTALSGPADRWDNYRDLKPGDLPDVPRALLRDFVLYKLEPKERAKLDLKRGDSAEWRRVIEAYRKHFEYEGKQLRWGDHKKGMPGKGPR